MSGKSRTEEKSITNLNSSVALNTQKLYVSGGSNLIGTIIYKPPTAVVDPVNNNEITGPFISGNDIVFKTKIGGTIRTHTITGV
jgi:hypothetical protein